MKSLIPEEHARELADGVNAGCARVRLEIREERRARDNRFDTDYQFQMGWEKDTVEIQHRTKPVTVKYDPNFSRESIATVVLRAPLHNVRSRTAHDARIDELDARRATLHRNGLVGGVFCSYKVRFSSESGFEYSLQVPITNEADLDRLLGICNKQL